MRIQGRNLYLSWITMTQKEREEMYVESFTNKKTRSLFNKISTSIRIETNKRLRVLEKKGFDYGRTYNNLIRYLQIEQDKSRVPFLKEVNYDIDELMTINEQARKFLKSNYSKIDFREQQLAKRLKYFELDEKYQDMMAGWRRREKKEFIRWLSNEEASFAMDEYGTSDETIIILADAFHNSFHETNGMSALRRAMLEFNAGEISFNEAMKQVGVNIEDSHPDLVRRWHYDTGNRSTYTR